MQMSAQQLGRVRTGPDVPGRARTGSAGPNFRRFDRVSRRPIASAVVGVGVRVAARLPYKAA